MKLLYAIALLLTSTSVSAQPLAQYTAMLWGHEMSDAVIKLDATGRVDVEIHTNLTATPLLVETRSEQLSDLVFSDILNLAQSISGTDLRITPKETPPCMIGIGAQPQDLLVASNYNRQTGFSDSLQMVLSDQCYGPNEIRPNDEWVLQASIELRAKLEILAKVIASRIQ